MIPVNQPLLDGNEKRYLIECIETGWISSEGPFAKEFEERFAARVGRKHGIAVCNGSVALDAAVVALDIGPGDEVIMPTFTIISCAAAIVRAGATPVVVDCDPITWNMDVTRIEPEITPKTKAIMVVHIDGLPVDMDPVLDLAERYGLKIIEHAAEAHGLTYKGKPCGSFGNLSTFSFYPNKLVTASRCLTPSSESKTFPNPTVSAQSVVAPCVGIWNAGGPNCEATLTLRSSSTAIPAPRTDFSAPRTGRNVATYANLGAHHPVRFGHGQATHDSREEADPSELKPDVHR